MTYKGYVAKIEFDEDNSIFTGMVINTRTVITFSGTSVRELEKEFRNSVEDYLEWCREDGVSPEKPYSGTAGPDQIELLFLFLIGILIVAGFLLAAGLAVRQ